MAVSGYLSRRFQLRLKDEDFIGGVHRKWERGYLREEPRNS